MPDRSDRVTTQRRLLKPRRRFPEIVVRCGIVLLLGLVAGHLGFSRYADTKLRQDLAHLRAAGVPIDPADFARPAVADADNAALDLIAAGEFLRRPSEVMDRFTQLTVYEPALPLDPDEAEGIAAAVQCGREALDRVDLAMQKPAVRWPQIGDDLMALRKLAWTPGASDITNLCQAAALAAHQRGDDADALRHIRRIIFVADAVGQDPNLVAQSTAEARRAQAARTIFQVAPALRILGAGRAGREAVRALIATFATPGSREAAYVHGLEGSRTQTWEALKAYADGRTDVWSFHGHSEWERRFGCAILRPFSLNDARLLLARDTRLIEAARSAGTWPAAKQAFPDSEIPADVRRYWFLHIPGIMFWSYYDHALKGHYRSVAAQRAAATVLAVRLYSVDHDGRLPGRLEDLVPAYLPAVPLDPLTDGDRPLGYRADPANPILYSVGEDGIDQGGSTRPIKESAAHLIDGDFDTLTEDAVVHLILPPRIRHD